MLNAAAMFVGLWLLWLLLVQQIQSVDAAAIGVAVALLSVFAAARLGALGGRGGFGATPRLAPLCLGRASGIGMGAASMLRTALIGGGAVNPALVRVRTRASSAAARAALCDLISATPGAVVIESDDEGLLVHVLHEDQIDGASLSALESKVIAALDGGAAP